MWVLRDGLLALLHDEQGATMVEYGFMLGLIAAVCVAAVSAIGTTTRGFYQQGADGFP